MVPEVSDDSSVYTLVHLPLIIIYRSSQKPTKSSRMYSQISRRKLLEIGASTYSTNHCRLLTGKTAPVRVETCSVSSVLMARFYVVSSRTFHRECALTQLYSIST